MARATYAYKRPAAAMEFAPAAAAAAAGSKRRRIGSTEDYLEACTLGEGGFGVVLKCRHRATGVPVAIKCLTAPDDDAAAEMLLREAGFLEQCSGDPYLVGFHGVVQEPATGELCLVMEYVDGPTLHDFLRRARRPLPESTVRAFMRQLLTGAKKMHGRHIIHRDIKPGNILVGRNGTAVKICDFGLAKSMRDAPPYGLAGTMPYIAPEVLMGKPDYDALVDTWSLGCVMAELVTGEELLPCAEDEDATSQLCRIFRLLGVPDGESWPEFASLPRGDEFRNVLKMRVPRVDKLGKVFPEEMLSDHGFEVLQGLLACNPDKRLTASAALKHPWFTR